MVLNLPTLKSKEKKLTGKCNELLDRPFINYNTHSILYATNNFSTRICSHKKMHTLFYSFVLICYEDLRLRSFPRTRQYIVCLQKYLLYIDVRITFLEVGLSDFFFTSSFSYFVFFYCNTLFSNNLTFFSIRNTLFSNKLTLFQTKYFIFKEI